MPTGKIVPMPVPEMDNVRRAVDLLIQGDLMLRVAEAAGIFRKRSGGPVYRMTPSSVMFDLSAVWFGRNECSLNTSPAPRALS